MNKIKQTYTAMLLALVLVISSCADLSVENLNQPDRERALSSDSDLISLLEGSTSDVFFYITVYYGVNINAYADMMTTTNMVNSWWVFTDQPRRPMPNAPTFSDLFVNSGLWGQFNSGVQTANTLITNIQVDGNTIVIDGVDRTDEVLANAYFLRGISKLYLGLIYDQGYNIFEDTNLGELELVPHGEITEAGLLDIEDAIARAKTVTNFVWDVLPTPDTYNINQFETMANAFMARGLAAKARTNAEAAAMDWQRVLDYANKAPGGDNAPAQMDGVIHETVGSYEYYNNLMDWSAYQVGQPGYLPPDIMAMHTLDPNYPTDYPTDAGVFLEEGDWNPVDPRSDYYGFTSQRFAMSADRNKALFNQYYYFREAGNSNSWGQTGQPYIWYLAAETDYLKTEAYLRMGNKIMAAQTLNQSPFGSGQTDFSPDLPQKALGNMAENGISGGNTISPTASDAEFQFALLREYTVEISLMGGIGNQWSFMRRWDMLQEGTPTHYPIPADELEITGRAFYTFGGVANAGQPGTASGANSWKELAQAAGLAKISFTNSGTTYSASDVKLNQSNTTRIGKDHIVREQ